MHLTNHGFVADDQATLARPPKNGAVEIQSRTTGRFEALGEAGGSVADRAVQHHRPIRVKGGERVAQYLGRGVGIDADGTGQVAHSVLLGLPHIEQNRRHPQGVVERHRRAIG